jgi:hypothetical protein
MRTIAILTLIAVSSCSEPTEAIHSAEGPLATTPTEETHTYDPAYLDELLRRHEDVFWQLEPVVANLPQETIDAILAGELDEREVLELGEEEYRALVRELGALAEESAAVLAEPGLVLEKKNDGKDKVTCKRGYSMCLMASAVMSSPYGPAFAVHYFVRAMVCLCTFCKGGYVEKVCG